MSNDNILFEIKKVEEEAREIEEKAGLKKDKIIVEARKTAQQMIDSIKDDALKTSKKEIEDASKRFKLNADKVNNDSKKDAEKLVAGSKKKISDASDYVVKEFNKKII